ncbi:hypothetical protein MHLP_04420 [Candidatus Mycoplasma haematolamae str. Purdue]|uniref:Uncharacterized protein n=1 Tax=Mycoplasma haematolamae (strain Purdue) TaxID=1212765 RepID=I7CKT7_MYCHA|nr:hypothetical protein [Candidatus Mycoplasma haematolamae]AFO52464.1 hypothetical protein MHLP_04420 [Candidatus Mycoplasma haematolamae str. Purdue]
MWFSIHPGIWGAIATLTTGLAANVVVSTAYQSSSGVEGAFDLTQIPEGFKEGKFDSKDPVQVARYKYYQAWQYSALWYTLHCKQNIKEKDLPKCKEHEETYWTAPEVKEGVTDIKKLQEYKKTLYKK